MLRQTTLFACCLVSLAAQAQAQSFVAPAAAWPNAGPVYFGSASTLAESADRGYADVLRADGSRTYDYSLAAGNFEDARSKWLINRQAAVKQYFDLRLLNQSYRQALSSKSTPKAGSASKISRSSAPASPAPVLANGEIDWPTALESPAARDARRQLERVFRLRAAGSDTRLGTPEYRQASQALAEIGAELQSSIRTLPTAEYMAAKKVLKSLQHELTQPVEIQVASHN